MDGATLVHGPTSRSQSDARFTPEANIRLRANAGLILFNSGCQGPMRTFGSVNSLFNIFGGAPDVQPTDAQRQSTG
jgi:hypothetical protein